MLVSSTSGDGRQKDELLRAEQAFFPNERKYVSQLRTILPNYDDLVVFAARGMHTEVAMAAEIERQRKLLKECQMAFNAFASDNEKLSSEAVRTLLGWLAESGNDGAKAIIKGVDIQKRRLSKSVVSHRIDQRLKPLWEKHCQDALLAGIEISRLADLFAFNNCDPEFKKCVDERTLKRWAKDVGVILKPGRPSKIRK